MSTVYDSIYGNGEAVTVNYTSSNPTVTYPDASLVNILGPIFAPRVHAHSLDHLELGSAGAIAYTLSNQHALDMSFLGSTVTLEAKSNYAIDLSPSDTAKTIQAGDMTSSSSNAYQLLQTSNANGFMIDEVTFSNVTITGAFSYSGSGGAAFDSLNVTGDATLNSNLTVTGTATFQSNVQIDEQLAVTGDAALAADATVGGTLGVTSTATFSSNVQVDEQLAVTGATTLSSTLGVTSTATFSSNVQVDEQLAVTGDAALAANATVGGTLGVTSTATFSSNVQVDEQLAVTGAAALASDATVGGTLGVTDTATFSSNVQVNDKLGVTGTATFSSNVTGTDMDLSGDLSVGGNVAIGSLATPTYSLDITGTDAILVPVGTTAQRPAGEAGLIRYNSTLTLFEGYSSGSWSSLGGVRDVDGDTYIITETSAGNDDDAIMFYTAGSETMRLTTAGALCVGATSATAGYVVDITGSERVSSNLLVLGDLLANTNGRMATFHDATIEGALNVTGNFDLSGSLIADNITTTGTLTLSATTISLDGDVDITGTLNTVNTSNVTVEDKVVILASTGDSNAWREDGALNSESGIVIEGVPNGFQNSDSNAQYYEKSILWNYGSTGVEGLASNLTFDEDARWEMKGGAFWITRYDGSNYGMDFTDGSNVDVTSISYAFRINSDSELEIVKVQGDAAGALTGTVIARWGTTLPSII